MVGGDMRMIESRLVSGPFGRSLVLLKRKKNLKQKYQVRDISPMTQPVIGWAFSLKACKSSMGPANEQEKTSKSGRSNQVVYQVE